MITNQDPSRAEFEAYLRTEGYGGYTIKLFRSGNMPPDIRERWEGWQAARRASSVAPAIITLRPQHRMADFERKRDFEFYVKGFVECREAATVAANAAPSTPAVAEGMPASQEPKYGIRDNRLYNRASGEFIPEDEPVFIFRARDVHAFGILAHYGNEVCNPAHASAILARVNDFKRFWNNNPDRMKEPDTDASPADSAQADDVPIYKTLTDHNGKVTGVQLMNADKMPSYAADGAGDLIAALEALTESAEVFMAGGVTGLRQAINNARAAIAASKEKP